MKRSGKQFVLSGMVTAVIITLTSIMGSRSMAGPVASPSPVLIIPLAPGEGDSRQDIVYHCDGDLQHATEDEKRLLELLPGGASFRVSYYNADMTALAVLPLNGKVAVFANVIAGSGAKYVADRYIWWTKGDDADFSVEGKDTRLTCHAVMQGDEPPHNNAPADHKTVQ